MHGAHCYNCGYARMPMEGVGATCPRCKKDYADRPPIVSEHQSDPRPETQPAPVTHAAPSSNPRRLPGRNRTTGFTLLGYPAWFTLFMLSGTIVFVLVFVSASMRPSSAARSNPIYDASAAQFACQGFVENRLKAPSTADFAPFHKMAISGSGTGPWSVRGYVDSQNSFGAKLRSSFTCTVEFSGADAKLIELTIH